MYVGGLSLRQHSAHESSDWSPWRLVARMMVKCQGTNDGPLLRAANGVGSAEIGVRGNVFHTTRRSDGVA